jgi:hypothetical protein
MVSGAHREQPGRALPQRADLAPVHSITPWADRRVFRPNFDQRGVRSVPAAPA